MADRSTTTDAPSIHQQIINDVLASFPGRAKTHGFFSELRGLPDASYTTELLTDDPKWAKWVNFIPDAWLIDLEERHVVVFEAVHTNEISETKFAKMADLSWALDEDYYTLILVRCDRFGRRAYHVQMASLFSMIDDIDAGREPDKGWRVRDWPKYDSEHCAARVRDAA